jgi:hypothetical protein
LYGISGVLCGSAFYASLDETVLAALVEQVLAGDELASSS